jgi:hypothetical protein
MVHKDRYLKPVAPTFSTATRAADCNCPRATARRAALITTIKLLDRSHSKHPAPRGPRQAFEQMLPN